MKRFPSTTRGKTTCQRSTRKSWFAQHHELDWLPLIILTALVIASRHTLKPWMFTWVLAAALFFGCKWLTWRRALRNGCRPSPFRSWAYCFASANMDARAFLAKRRARSLTQTISARQWTFATGKTLLGAVIIWGTARNWFGPKSLAIGWLGMVGLVMFLHFGLFHLVALGWRSAGVETEPIMRSPLMATSLADFWSTRWNRAFSTLVFTLAFRPMARQWGASVAVLGVFLLSGIVHEAVISFPVAQGFGWPTVYFGLQGLGVLLERSKFGQSIRLGQGVLGRIFTLAFTVGPAFILFHPPFVRGVILPMLSAIGTT